MRRKWEAVSLLSAMLLFLVSCAEKSPVEMTRKNTEAGYAAIIWEDREYVPFCAISNSAKGKWIGIIDHDENDRVYEYEGYSSEEWIISFYKSGLMDGSMLMKEINVSDIPAGLESEYEWNN